MEKLIYGGDGLGRVEGKVCLTPFVLPGEVARVSPSRQTAGFMRASLVEVVRPSARRVTPGCPHFGPCGGCQYQHAEYEFQLEQKVEITRDALRRVGKIAWPEEVRVVSGPPWEYRNRSQFHIHDGRIGYHHAGSRRLHAIDRCPISSPRVNEALAALRRMLPQPRFPRFLRSIEVFTDERQVQINIRETTGERVAKTFFEWCAAQIPGDHVTALDYQAAGETFRVSHQSFFQVNRFLADRLVAEALEGAAGEFAVDLYAGVGLFSIPLSRRFQRVQAVETNAASAADLRFNAERAGASVEARNESAEAYLANLAGTPDFLAADPPRAGLGKAVVEQLLLVKPRRLAIVSCDPSTLARDLRSLLAGGYRLESLAVVDLFPQTAHIETVVRLEWSDRQAA
ncbi:MAG: class I SAM-dependent RNA methyltransferase [Bryobacteraceae bacterium]|nr:class I SAM-dependent RNA methyltransferase [Bryobacteraceae bacterium]